MFVNRVVEADVDGFWLLGVNTHTHTLSLYTLPHTVSKVDTHQGSNTHKCLSKQSGPETNEVEIEVGYQNRVTMEVSIT